MLFPRAVACVKAMALDILVLPFILGFIQGTMCSLCEGVEEPCYLSDNIEMPYLNTRNPLTLPTEDTLQYKYCDLYAVHPDTWYRSEYEMTTQVVQQQTCGTIEPIWLNGTIPEVADGIVSREACVRSFSDPCVTTYTVKIKQCQYYTVYCFPAVLSGCHQRYCFEVNITETTTSTTSTTTTSTTASSNNCDEHVVDNSCNNCAEQLDDNSSHINVVKAVVFTLVVCLIVFGTVLAIVIYLLRRRVFPQDKYRTSSTLYSNDEMNIKRCPDNATKQHKCLSIADVEGKVKQSTWIKR